MADNSKAIIEDRKIIIFYIIGELAVGGTERHLCQILPGIVEAGFKPIVFTMVKKGQLASELEVRGIEVIEPWGAESVKRVPKLLRPVFALPMCLATLIWKMLRYRPDIVHTFLPAAYLIGGLTAVATRIPVRIMSRRSLNNYQQKYPFLTRMEYWLHNYMTVILANSQAVLSQLLTEGVDRERLRLIYNGIDIEKYKPFIDRDVKRQDFGIPSDSLVMIIVANLIPYKRHTDLLTALARITDRLAKGWLLFCVGRDDGIGKVLKEEASNLGIEANVRWLGPRQDVPQLLAIADIGLLCSCEEGFSNSLLECMAAGLPMVVTDAGGNPEAVENGITGLVVPAQDPAALGSAILNLATNQELRANMGKAGNRRVKDHFTVFRCVAQYSTFYKALASGKHIPELGLQ